MKSAEGVVEGNQAAAACAPPAVARQDIASIDVSSQALPPGAMAANVFGLFNNLSWQIMLGAPTILYAKSQGASALILGLLAALMPLLVVFQLPAAKYLPKYGYRRFILAGWGSRSLFIFFLAVVPLLPVAPWIKVGLILVCSFGFNLLRGITSGAWLPWITELIPEPVRGRFLSRDSLFGQVGAMTSLLSSAFLLGGHPTDLRFSLVFLLSAAAATLSLVFLRHVPDVTAPERIKTCGHRVPWAQMLVYPPFLRLLIFSIGWAVVGSGLPVFAIAFLKEVLVYDERQILLLSCLSVLGALVSVPIIGRHTDRIGSKPILLGSLLLFLGIMVGWWALAGGIVVAGVGLVGTLYFLMGVGFSNQFIASQRLLMGTVPMMGRNHFCALFNVLSSLVQGLSPILWGVMLDSIGPRRWSSGSVDWNRYSIYFGLVLLLAFLVAGYTLCLHESKTSPRQR